MASKSTVITRGRCRRESATAIKLMRSLYSRQSGKLIRIGGTVGALPDTVKKALPALLMPFPAARPPAGAIEGRCLPFRTVADSMGCLLCPLEKPSNPRSNSALE